MIRKLQFYLFITLMLFVGLTTAQQKVLTAYSIFELQQVIESAISPDGSHAAFSLLKPRPFTDKPGGDYRELYLYSMSENKAFPAATGNITVSSLQWHGNNLYFLSRLNDAKTLRIYKVTASNPVPEEVFAHTGHIMQYQVSPDGSTIAFVADEDRIPEKKALLERGFDAEFYEEEFKNQSLYLAAISDKSVRQLTKNVTITDFEYSPDGSYIAALATEKNLVDDTYMLKDVYTISLQTGELKRIVDVPGKISAISVSPDGMHIAFIAGANINDSFSGSLFCVPADTPTPFTNLRNYTTGLELSATKVSWLDNGTMIYAADEGVYTTLRTQKVDEKESALVLKPGIVSLTSFSVAGEHVLMSADTKMHPRELFIYNLSNQEIRRLTDHNPSLANTKLGLQERIVYDARDGLKIEGVLMYPVDFEKGKQYPLIVYIHGGPEACEKDGWNTGYSKWGQVAAGEGYFVFLPNYRASSGRGPEFSYMGFGDLAGKEFEDVLDGIDHLIKLGYVDKDRVGIGGGSYGGYFTNWAATKHSTRFACGVSFVGVSNQISKTFSTDIPYEDYYVHWGVYPIDNPTIYLDRSPVMHVKDAKTPLLLMHGKEDPRVPVLQSVELYSALKMFGKAPVRLVMYPGQGHGNSKNTSRLDFAVRSMEWFNYYLKGNNPKDQMPRMIIDFEK